MYALAVLVSLLAVASHPAPAGAAEDIGGWSPPTASLPDSPVYLYLQWSSDDGATWHTFTATSADTNIRVSSTGNGLGFSAQGFERWGGITERADDRPWLEVGGYEVGEDNGPLAGTFELGTSTIRDAESGSIRDRPR